MSTRSVVERFISFLIVLSLLLVPLAPTVSAQEGSTASAGDLPASAPAQGYEQPAVDPIPGSQLAQQIREGRWPSQTASSTGNVQPSRYGPQRHNPEDGIPRYAYSPFDERNNREYPCPPGGCTFEADTLLIKLAPEVNVLQGRAAGAWTNNADLNQALSAQDLLQVEPLFPTATRPLPGQRTLRPDGGEMETPDLTRWHRVRLGARAAQDGPSGQDAVLAAVERMVTIPGIVYAEPDFLRRPAGELSGGQWSVEVGETPAREQRSASSLNDPLYAQQWHLAAANITQAWDYLSSQGLPPGGSRDIVVAVIDTGVDYTHPDLAANMWINPAEFYGQPGVDDDGNGYVDDIHGVTVVSGQRSGDPQDDHGHGTHVAGIIAAQAGNGIGGVGVAYNVQIMAIKAAQYSGVLSSSDIAQGIYYAVEKGADVINMSFGGYARSQLEEDALAVAFGQAVLVAAAGNDGKVNLPCGGGRDMYPAAYNWVLGVMASTQGGELARFSNFDCTPRDSHEYELMAPGVGVWSTLPNGQYAAWAGTSMATPVVAGIAALARTKWADKDVYSSRFIMGQIASNAGPVANALAALTVAPQPELSYLEHWLFDTPNLNPINDNDGIVDAGETIDLAIVIRNHWGKADNVSVKLEAWAEGAFQADPYVTFITDTIDYGAVGSFNRDDNGLIYDQQGVITGVRHPFRLTVDPNTPNDHVIPFRLTIVANNGYDPTDPNAPYTFSSNFYLIVQRGRELPRIISEDMVLTKDYYWLVPDATLVKAGVTVTVDPGTQVQFWSSSPSSPYQALPMTVLQVDGNLLIQGQVDDPVELFGSPILFGRAVEIQQGVSGNVEISYSRVLNPYIGSPSNIVPTAYPIHLIQHSYFAQEHYECVYVAYPWDTDTGITCEKPYARAQNISSSKFYKLGAYGWKPIEVDGSITTSLFDSCHLGIGTSTVAQNTVFLRNFKAKDSWWGSSWPSEARVDGYCCQDCTPVEGSSLNTFRENAILNLWWYPSILHWMRFVIQRDDSWSCYISDNYWGTTGITLIEAAIHDYHDSFNLGTYVYQPILTKAPESAYPFVVDALLSTAGQSDMSALNGPTPIISAEPVTFTVTFNRDMDPTIHPAVSFGPDVPLTDYTIHPINGGWVDARTWQGTFSITPVTGDGYQLIRVAGPARSADDHWLVIGDDSGRFRFEIITSGTEAMNLQANGGEGYVDLMWTQTDFDLLAGFNLYRATSADGQYTRINSNLIPAQERTYRDTDVIPGQPYFYKFTVVQTSMAESDFSNTATATPIDTIAPSISHTPVTTAPSGLPLTLIADVTDNVAVTAVTLFHRRSGTSTYTSRAMTRTTGDRYTATLEGSLLVSPGVDYYIQAGDGVNVVRNGRAELPHTIVVDDRPTVTSITPNRGSATGGTIVTIRGSNFKTGATVSFGGALAEAVQVQSSSQISATTPANIPVKVDVRITNSDGQSGALLQGYTYEADAISLGVADGNGGQGGSAEIAISAANVRGLVAADLTLTFDSAILQGVSARIGNLTPGWTLATNTSTPGQVRLSLVSTGGSVSGSGVLAHLLFDVIGAPGSSSALQLGGLSFNDGAISAQVTPGTFTVDNVYDVSGQINFWNGGTISNTQLTLQGERLFTGVSLADGTYTVRGAPAGNYTLTPAKSDEANGIGAYDASLALQHAAGLNILSGPAAVAADVNRSGSINSMDAYYILQKAVGLITLPFPGAGAVWTFDPSSRSITSLNVHSTGQDFSAILLGDPSGNWTGGATLAAFAEGSLAPLVVRVAPMAGNVVTATLWVDAAASPVHAVDLALQVTGAKVDAMAITLDPQAAGWIEAANVGADGRVQMAVAGAQPFAGGALAVLRFTVQQPTDGLTFTPIMAALDEAPVGVQVEIATPGATMSIYLPMLQR